MPRPLPILFDLSALLLAAGLAACAGTGGPVAGGDNDAGTPGGSSGGGPTGSTDFVSAGASNRSGQQGTDATGASEGPTDDTPGGQPSVERAIQEADIIRVDGTTLYLLNRWRGLQIVDLTQVDHPALLGRLPILGQPVEMVIAGGIAWVVASDVITYRTADGGSQRTYGSVVRAVDVTDPNAPTLLGGIDLEGDATHTLLLGHVLYALSAASTSSADGCASAAPQDGPAPAALSSIDAADPAHLALVDRLDLPDGVQAAHIGPGDIALARGVSGPVAASDGAPGGVSASSTATRVTLIDIADPDGALAAGGSVDVSGSVADDGQLDLDGTWLHVVSQLGDASSLRVTVIDAADAAHPVERGHLDLAEVGPLALARFDGQRLYAVTGDDHATLVAVDLSDPDAPSLIGLFALDGRVDHLEPLGDHLLGFGVDPAQGQQAALWLLDVSKGAAEPILDELLVGDAWSWTQGTWDEDAFQVVPESRLVLLPYSGLDPAAGQAVSALQLVQWTDAALIPRGRVEHVGPIRRARLYRNRILSFGDRQLQVIDAIDPDLPAVTAELVLARDVRRVLEVNGAALTQVGGSGYDAWDPAATTCADCLAPGVEPAEYRLAPLADPEGERTVYASFSTSLAGPVLFVHGSYAYVLGIGLQPGATFDPSKRDYFLEVWDLRDVHHPVRQSRAALEGIDGFYYDVLRGYGAYGLNTNAYEVGASVVLLQPRRVGYLPGYADAESRYEQARTALLAQYAGSDGQLDDAERASWAQAQNALDAQWQTEQAAYEQVLNPNRLLVIDLADPALPRLASVVDLPFDESPFNFRTAGMSLLFQHVQSLGVDSQGQQLGRYYVTGVDLADPAHPQVTGPVNVPGQVVDVAPDGVTLYTHDVQYTGGPNGEPTVRSSLDTLLLRQGLAYLEDRLEIDGTVGNLIVDGGVATGILGAGESTPQAGATGVSPGGATSGGDAATTCPASATSGELRLETFDLRDPEHLAQAADVIVEARTGWLRATADGRAFLDLDDGQGMLVLDVSQPTSPALVGYYRTQGWVEDITVSSGRAYLATGLYGVQVIDLTE